MNHPQSVLIIDEETQWVETLTSLLNEIDLNEIQSVGNRAEALKEYAEHKFDLVLLEVKPPETEGIDFIKEIRQKLDPNTKIIVLSTISQKQTVLNCVYAGALQYIIKSSDPRSILKKITDVIGKDTSEPDPEQTNKPARSQFASFL